MLYEHGNAANYVEGRPQQYQPGTHYQYSTGDTQLLAEHDESGGFIGGARMFMTSHDWLKIGQLILQQGQWTLQGESQQLVSPEWIHWISQPSPAKVYYGGQLWLGNMEPDVAGITGDAVFLRGLTGRNPLVRLKKCEP